MERSYLQAFTQHTGFAPRDSADLLAAWDALGKGGQSALAAAGQAYENSDFSTRILEEQLSRLEGESGIHRYTLWLLALIHCSRAPFERAADKELLWQTFSDLRYKVRECRDMYGICGNFVGFWYPIFFKDAIVKLGRLEFETCPYEGRPLSFGGFTLNPGDMAYSIHIPSSGEPFTKEARLDAYRRAYIHFGCAEKNKPLVCFCESWLLYPPYTDALPGNSRIRDFSRDFCTVYGQQTEDFDDFWRVFGREDKSAPQTWPEDSQLRRMLKTHFLSGGSAGFGMGLLVFDGEKLLQTEENP